MGTTKRRKIKIIKGPHSGKEMKADREINFHYKDRRHVYVVADPDIKFIAGHKVKEV